MKYPCTYCEYLKTGASHLKKHDVTLHKGERYSWSQCDYALLVKLFKKTTCYYK